MTPDPRSTVLVTGARGYVGGLVARRLRDEGADVVVHGRQADDPTPAGGVHGVAGDLADDDPFAGLSEDRRDRITAIVHAGAITRFDVDEERARAVNVDGTAKVLDFARRCPRLDAFGLVSTVYATGLRAGRVAEELYDDQPGFANAYEWSKWRAEHLVAETGDDLPWRILRVATVIADDESGRVSQHNAFHETLKLWFHGLLPLLPGDPHTPLYLVTGDFVARAIVSLMRPNGSGGVFHLAHDVADSLTLGQAVDVVSDAFEAVDGFRRRRVLRPLLGDEESFDLLASGVDAFGGGLVRQSLQSVVPFARQLFVAKQLDNARLRAALDGYAAPDAAALVRRTCDHLVASRWGRHAVA
jgi:nucleoside-diphosphate-sugar epimerase